MKRSVIALIAAACLGALPLAALAEEGFAAKDIHLRAGPARDYPVVAIVSAGTSLDVQGCLADYSWCDVIALGERGWVYAANIEYVYGGTPVPLIDYGPVVGITVVPFFLDDYWDRWYYGRPWYPRRDYWRHRPMPPQPPIPPRPLPKPLPQPQPPQGRPPDWVPAPRPVQPSPPRAVPQPPVTRPAPTMPRPMPPAQGVPPPAREAPRNVPPPRAVQPGPAKPPVAQ